MILLRAGLESDAQVYDLDSELSFPCSLELYASQALRSDHSLRPMYHRYVTHLHLAAPQVSLQWLWWERLTLAGFQ